MPLRAGKLRHRVSIERLTETVDDYGAVDRSSANWASIGTVWAAIEPLRGVERLEASQLKESVDTQITMRPQSFSVNASDRVAFGSRIFDIVSVINPQEIGEQLILLCREAR